MTDWEPEERHLVVLAAVGPAWRTLSDIRTPRDPRLTSMRSVLGRLVKLREEGYVEYRLAGGVGEYALTEKGRRAIEEG